MPGQEWPGSLPNISPDRLETDKALADVTSRIRTLPPFEAPDLDALITDPLLANRPLPPFHVRSAPYDYPGQDNGNSRMVPDEQAGVLSLSGKAGRVDGSQGDFVRGVCWTGIAVTNESAAAQPFQTVRISPIVSWEASWGLGYVGGTKWSFWLRSLGSGARWIRCHRVGRCRQPSWVLSASRCVLGSAQRHGNLLGQR
jgi:hypothetical protein